jgi:hypothetical protein
MVPFAPPLPGLVAWPQAAAQSRRPSGTAASELIRLVMNNLLKSTLGGACLMHDSVQYARYADSVVDSIHNK